MALKPVRLYVCFSGIWAVHLMDGVTCDFTSFSTVSQSYQHDGRLIMKGCEEWSSIYC